MRPLPRLIDSATLAERGRAQAEQEEAADEHREEGRLRPAGAAAPDDRVEEEVDRGLEQRVEHAPEAAERGA